MSLNQRTINLITFILLGLLSHTAVGGQDEDEFCNGIVPIGAPWDLVLPLRPSCARFLAGLTSKPDQCSSTLIRNLEPGFVGSFSSLLVRSYIECGEEFDQPIFFDGGVDIIDTKTYSSTKKTTTVIKFNSYYSLGFEDCRTIGQSGCAGGGSVRCQATQTIDSPGLYNIIFPSPSPGPSPGPPRPSPGPAPVEESPIKPLRFRYTNDLTVGCETFIPFVDLTNLNNIATGVRTYEGKVTYRGVCTECGCNYATEDFEPRVTCSIKQNFRDKFNSTYYIGVGCGVALLAGGALLYRKRKRSFAAQQNTVSGPEEQAEGEEGQESQAVNDKIDEDTVSAL